MERAETYIDPFEQAGAPRALEKSVVRTPVWPKETLEAHATASRDLHDQRDLYGKLDTTPREILDERTLRRLKTLVSYAYARIPFYKNLYKSVGFEPGDLKSLSDFARLPTVSKADLQNVYSNVSVDPWVKINFKSRTSGSTGVPLSLINDSDRQRHWYVKRILMLEDMMGEPLQPEDWIYSYYYEPFFLTSIFGEFRTFTVGLNANPEDVVAHIRAMRPKVITGVARQILAIAKMLPDAGKLGILALTTNSESSSFAERRRAETVTGVPVLDEYSSEELGIIAWERSDGLYRVAEDTVHLELVNGASTNMASVVGTDLWNFAMPRIRYLQGDFAEWHAPNPSQGLRRLKRIVGRQDMQLISPTFGAIDPGRILEIFDTTLVPEPAGIAEFRLVQKTREDVRLLVRLAGNRGGAKDAIARFQTRFSEIFGEQNDLKIEFVEALPNLGVKKRCILREFHA